MRRLQQHVNSGKITLESARNAQITWVNGSRSELRVLEQNKLQQLGGKEALTNKRNEIFEGLWDEMGVSRTGF